MNFKHSMYASGLWLSLFAIGISLMFLPLITPWASGFLFSAVFPVAVWMISQNKYFHVKANNVVFAALITWFFSFLIGYIKNVQNARKDPIGHKLDASLYYSLMSVFFVVMMVVVGPRLTGGELHPMRTIPVATAPPMMNKLF